MAFEIIFKLKPINEILPFGTGDNKSIHFFALTDSEYYYKINDITLLEYTSQAMKKYQVFKRFNIYYLEVLVRNLSEIMPFVIRDIPQDLYNIIKNQSIDFNTYLTDILESIEVDNSKFDLICNMQYYLYGCRMIEHSFLKNYLDIYFYKCGDKLLIKWECSESYVSKSNQVEVSWNEFKADIQSFFDKFIHDMKYQIENALRYDCKDIQLDKPLLVDTFEKSKKYLKNLFSEFCNVPDLYFSPDFLNTENLFEDINKVKNILNIKE